MRTGQFSLLILTLTFACGFASAEALPRCDAQAFTRHGRQITMSTSALSGVINQRLAKAHSHFSDIQLIPQGGNKLKVSGKKDGTPIAISGPLKVDNGQMVLQTDHITKNGSGEMVLMTLFGKTLSDYLNLKKTPNLHVDGNNLRLNPDGLLGVHSTLKSVHLQGSNMHMEFASVPCQ